MNSRELDQALNGRMGCLVLLVVWALCGIYVTVTQGFNDEGGSSWAVGGAFGLAVFVIWSIADRASTRRRRVDPATQTSESPPKQQ